MAGSWNHSVTEEGQLRNAPHLRDSLENGGDVWEYAEEAYGMVWYLANRMERVEGGRAADYVEEARVLYATGVALSPGLEPNEE